MYGNITNITQQIILCSIHIKIIIACPDNRWIGTILIYNGIFIGNRSRKVFILFFTLFFIVTTIASAG